MTFRHIRSKTYLFVVVLLLATLVWPSPMTSRTAQAQQGTPQLFYPVMHRSVQDTGRTWNGVFSIQSMSLTPTNVQLIFYPENASPIVINQLTPVGGSPVSNPFMLSPGTAISFDMTSISPVLSSGKYSVVVVSNQPLAGVGWTRISGGAQSSGMYNAFMPAAASTTAYLPAVKTNASGVGGNLAIQNLSNAAANGVLVKFYNQQGQQVGQVNAPTIEPYSSFHLNSQQFGVAPGFDGSVVVSSPSPVVVVNNQLTGTNDATLETYVSEAQGAAAFTTILNPVTKLTVMNTSPNQPANVTVTVQNGAPGQQMIAPLGSHTFNLNMQVQDIATVVSDQPVVAVAVNASASTGAAVEADRGQGSMRYMIPFAANQYTDSGGSTTSNLVVYNPGSGFLTFQVIHLQQGQPVFTNFGTGPGSIMVVRPQDLPGLPTGINSFLVQAVESPFGPPAPFFMRVSTQTTGPAGDGLAFYNGIPVPQPPVTIQKTASKQYLKGGDSLTYNLLVSVGSEAGNAVITDDLPDQFTNYTYSVSPGLVLTQTAGADFVWNAYVPASGGVITITGVVTSPVDVGLPNTASIATPSGNASSNVMGILDVNPPRTEITDQPASVDSNTTPTFTFTGADNNAQGSGSGVIAFECKVDDGDFAPCTSPHTTASLSDGEHTFQVRAIDRAGYVDPTPASYTWTIDTTAPAVPALSSPANSAVITSTDVVTLTWQAVEDADVDGYEVTFNGQAIDAGNVTQRVVGPLANGVYSWTVSSYDGAGNNSANAAVRTFTVDKRLLIDPEETTTTPLAGSGGFTPTLTIPAGSIALTGTLEMSYQPLPTDELPAPPNGGLLLGFSLDLFQNGAVQSGVVFSKPITISIAYDSALVSDPSSLQLFYLDENDEWSSDGITILTPVGNPLIATLTHLTDFGLAEMITTRYLYLPTVNR